MILRYPRFSFRRNDLQPVSVRIIDEVNPHFRIFKTDAAHLRVLFVGGLHVVGDKGQMDLVVPKIITP